MYCQACAAEIQPGLNYCNRCGAVTNSSLATRPDIAPVDIKSPVRTLGITVTTITLLGIIILFIGLSGLASWGMHPALLGMIGFSMITSILVVDIMLIRLLSRVLQLPGAATILIAEQKRPEAREMFKPTTQAYMPPAATDPLMPIASVTDHTTRTLRSVYQEPQVKS